MAVVVPAPLLLNVPALVKRPAEPPKLLLLISASSVALNVPLFWNSEPGLAPPLELMFSVPPLRLATPLLTSVRVVLLPLPKVFEPAVLIVSVAVLSIVVVPVLASVPLVQLKAP